jgi:pilus assembly protein Flp/PilA
MLDAFTALVVRAQNSWYSVREGESGQGLVEYALIIALVSLAAIAALGFLSGRINGVFQKAGNVLNTVNP